MFTFLEDEGVDDVIKSGDHMTPEVDDAMNDKAKDNADKRGEISCSEPHTEATDNLANSLVTSSPTKSPEDVADLEFRGILCRFVCIFLSNWYVHNKFYSAISRAPY